MLSTLLTGTNALAERLYIDINAPGIKPMPTAVPALRVIGDISQTAGATRQPHLEVAATLRRDLNIVGEFDVLSPDGYLEDPQLAPLTPSDESFAEWRMLGAELLIKGQIMSGGGDEFIIELHAYDVARRAFVFGKRYRAPADTTHEVAHKFANTIMLELTGKEGPFGTEIAYMVRKGRSINLFSSEIDGSNRRQLTDNPSENMTPKWSRDGVSVYLTSFYGGSPDLCKVDIPSGKLRYVFKGQGYDIPGEESPDGKTLLYAATRGENADIYALDMPRKKIRRLTTDRAIDVSPNFSPDGKRFVFVSDRRGNPHLFVGNFENPDEAPVRITFRGKHNGDPVWSPDGEKIAYTGMDDKGIFQVYLVDPNGKNNMAVTSGRYDTEQPSWSPDGRFLAVTSNRDGNKAVYVLRLGINKLWQVSPAGAEASQPSWSYGPVAH